MRIIIGDTPYVSSTGQGRSDAEPAMVEARLLKIRSPRRRRGGPPAGQKERRNSATFEDPPAGRVLVLLVPEGYKIPRGVETGTHKICLRFVPHVPARA